MVEEVRGAGRREWAALAVLILAVSLLAVDATVLILAIPSLTADLSVTSSQLLWIGDIYSFTLAGLLVTMGNLADRIGRRRLLLLGSVGFAAASAIAAFAGSAEVLIAARVLLGISGATIMPSTLSIIRNLFDVPAQRTRAIAIWSAGITGGAALGPLVGGLLLEHFWWGSVFLINVPIVALVVIGGAILLPESKNSDNPRVDLLSAALSFLAITPIVYALKHAVNVGIDPTVVVSASFGVVAGLAFVHRQRRLTSPLVDVSLFRVPAFSGAVITNTLAIFAFTGLLYFFSQFLQLVRGLSPLQAGLVELPSVVASIGVIAVAGPVVARVGTGPAIGLGLAVAAAGLGMLALVAGQPGFTMIMTSLVVAGVGIGLTMTLSVDAVVTAVPKARAGAASSVSETAYELGVALGVAVLGSLQTALYRHQLNLPAATPDAMRRAAEDSLANAARATNVATDVGRLVLETARHSFTTAMQYTTATAVALLLVAAFVAARIIPANRTNVASRD
ncbi:MFS transporter [Nocardia pseudovaccinii]|uniref:MFS transporter n=1 Tax=Nocardia pseudovaccinii TaxID=189540 RepID=UPI003D913F94